MTHINIPLSDLVVRQDHNSHTCLEYFRGDKWSEYLAFEPQGLVKFRETTTKLEERFNRIVFSITPEQAALSFLRASKRAYLPEDGVNEIIMEIYIMAASNGSKLSALDIKELFKLHNDLATALKLPTVNSVKDTKAGKESLIGKIEDLQSKAKALTGEQSKNKANAAEASGKRSAAANGDKPAGAKKPGIGAFCMDLIINGKSNEEVIAAAKKQFPGANTSTSSVSWYRNKLKQEGKLPKDAVAAKPKAAEKAAPKAATKAAATPKTATKAKTKVAPKKGAKK
jgi:hypothetical protein